MQNLRLERCASGGDWDIVPLSFAGSNANYKGLRVLGDAYYLQSDDDESPSSHFLEFPYAGIGAFNDVVVPDVPDSPTIDQFVFDGFVQFETDENGLHSILLPDIFDENSWDKYVSLTHDAPFMLSDTESFDDDEFPDIPEDIPTPTDPNPDPFYYYHISYNDQVSLQLLEPLVLES